MTTPTTQRLWLGPGQQQVRLAPTAMAPRSARRFVRSVCATVNLPERTVEDAALIAGELITASIREVRSPVELAVLAVDDTITVQVRDAATLAPYAGTRGVVARRSWDMVQRLGTSWGYGDLADGRVMWASFRAAAQPVRVRRAG